MKQKKTIRALLTLSLALILCIGNLTTAFAANPPSKEAAITKILQMPEGTTTPAAEFTFDIAAKSVDGVAATDPASPTNMPGIANKTIEFAATDTGSTTDGLKSVVEEVNVFASVVWPHAGVYVYTITETADTYDTVNGETMTYSSGQYEVTVYVANGEDGLYVDEIITTIKGKDTDEQTVGGKVVTIPGGGDDYDYSQMIFTNTYTKTNGKPDLPDPNTDGVLSISKTVAGNMGDKTKYFSYTLTITQAATLPNTTTYMAYVLDENDAVVTDTANYAGTIVTDGNGNKFFKLNAGANTVNLKHGQRVVLTDAVVGTSYVALEAAAANYTPTAVIVANGVSSNKGSTLNTALSTDTQLVGEAANSAAYTNTYAVTIPTTGISISNLPFIMMIIFAVGALAAFVVVKSRKNSCSK